MKKNVLLIGATGATGKEVLRELQNNDEIRLIHVLHYRSTSIEDREKVFEHTLPFEKLLDLRLEGIDCVFCCIGTTIKKAGSKERFAQIDRDFVIELGRWAKIMNVGSFHVISAMGADKDSAIFYNRVKGEMEEGLIRLNLNSLYIYHPPLLKAKRDEFRLGESVANAVFGLLSPLMIGALSKYRPLDVKKMAKKMMQNALSCEAGLHYVNSDEMHAVK